MNKNQFLIVVTIGCILFCNACKMENMPKKTENQGGVGENSIDFSLKELGEEGYVKLSDFTGKPVFIDFWATWCPPCVRAIPYVEKLYSKYKNEVQVIGINLDNNSSGALDYVNKNTVGYLQLEGYGTNIPAQYGVRGIPAFFIIDGNGKIVKKYVGFSPGYYEEWVKVLDSLIK